MLKTRLITVLWSIPLVIVAVWFDTPVVWFTIFASIVGILAAVEFYRLVGVAKIIPLEICGVALTVLFIISPQFNWNLDIPYISLLLTGAIALPMILMLFLPRQEGVFRIWAWTLAGVLYIGWFISYMVSLRLLPDAEGFTNTGRNLVFLTLFVTFGSDTTAYFIGKAIGKHKMAPSISPGKTWEGAVGGIIGAVIVCLIFYFKTPFQVPMNLANTFILGAAISIFGQIGDLAESMLKRGTGVKDSGTLMPGHGGMLDRLDSILFAGIVVFLYYKFILL